MFKKRQDVPKDDNELFGQDVPDDSLDRFEQPTNEEIDDIDLALESATLREVTIKSKTEQEDEDWDSMPSANDAQDVSEGLAESEVDTNNLSDEKIIDETGGNITDTPEMPRVGVSKSVFFSTILFLFALTGVGFFFTFNSFNATTEFIEPIQNRITQLISSQAENQLNTDNLQQAVTQTQLQMQSQVDSINTSTAELFQETSKLTAEIQTIQSELQSNTLQIKSALESLQILNDDMKNMETHLTSAISGIKDDVNAKARTTPPEINTENMLEGATLESVDLWHYNSYANLRTPDGRWISLEVTQRYKGWIIKHINKSSVVFTRNGQDKTLVING